MTQTVLKHIVKQGERWDNLAYHYYGNALEYSRIIATVFIPVLQVKPTNNEDMPPWLRGDNE